jgi:hypothetical protein
MALFYTRRATHIFLTRASNTERLQADQIAMSRAEMEGKERGEMSLLLGSKGASERCLSIVAANTALPTLHSLALLHAAAAVEKFLRKNGRSTHTHIQVRAFIFLILPAFPCAWLKKSASK